MSFTNKYIPFCVLHLYHHYFLDDGEDTFDNPAFPNLKEEQLAKYRLSDFVKIIPTEKTRELFRGQRILFKNSETGFILCVHADDTVTPNVYKPIIDLAQTESLQFLIYISDPLFENYSTTGAVPSIPYYFSNKQPFTETSGWDEINVESDFPHTPITDFTINTMTNDLLSALITKKERRGLFGVISLNVAADDPGKSILDLAGNTRPSPPTFKIQLDNRKTFWRYLSAKDGTVIHESYPTRLLPLVKNGIIDYTFSPNGKVPSAEPNRLVYVKDSNGNIIRTFSEIFI